MANRLWDREEFNAAWDFVVARPFATGQVKLRRGQDFDKKLVSERRLRQMFDVRMLGRKEGSVAPGPTPSFTPPPKKKVMRPNGEEHNGKDLYTIRDHQGEWFVVLVSNRKKFKEGPFARKYKARRKADQMNAATV